MEMIRRLLALFTQHYGVLAVCCCVGLLAGCAVTNQPIVMSAFEESEIPVTTRLDLPVAPKTPLSINVVVFDYDVTERLLIPIREAESGYMAVTLSNILQDSGQWAGVYVLPIANEYSEVQMSARILHSDASLLHLQVEVHDATERVWIDREYRARIDDDLSLIHI